MTDTLPDGVRLLNSVSANGAPVAYTADGGILVAKLGDIAVGETLKVKYEVLVLEEAAGTTLKNTVVLSGKDGSTTSKTDVPVAVPTTPSLSGPYVTKEADKVTAKVGSTATAADKRVTYTVSIGNGNGNKKTWEDVVFTDVLDDGLMKLVYDAIYVDGVRLNRNQFTYRNDCLTTALGDIPHDRAREVKFTVEFMSDAGKKSFQNTATATGRIDGEKIWRSGEAPIVQITDDRGPTDRHYAIFHGTDRGLWNPNRNLYLSELATTAYRVMTNDYQTALQQASGKGHVSDYVSDHFGTEVSYIVGAGILSSDEFEPTGSMTQGKDYDVQGPAEDPIYFLYATRDQIGRVLENLFGNNYGISGTGYMTRLDMAKLYCAIQGRDIDPNYQDAVADGMKIDTFPDAPGNATVIEVSNTHAYMIDSSYGNEIWVINEKMK